MHVDHVVGISEAVPECHLEQMMAFLLVAVFPGIRPGHVNHADDWRRQVAGAGMHCLGDLQHRCKKRCRKQNKKNVLKRDRNVHQWSV